MFLGNVRIFQKSRVSRIVFESLWKSFWTKIWNKMLHLDITYLVVLLFRTLSFIIFEFSGNLTLSEILKESEIPTWSSNLRTTYTFGFSHITKKAQVNWWHHLPPPPADKNILILYYMSFSKRNKFHLQNFFE